jgi:CubicO group peptidase (beta-lactamase class C family)
MKTTSPKDHGMSAERLARIEPLLEERYLGPGKLAMADVLVARHGETIYRATMGKARDDGTPLKDDAIFRIASMTKPVTSIAFMQLLEEGKIALDDPVAKVIPSSRTWVCTTVAAVRRRSFPPSPARGCEWSTCSAICRA